MREVKTKNVIPIQKDRVRELIRYRITSQFLLYIWQEILGEVGREDRSVTSI